MDVSADGVWCLCRCLSLPLGSVIAFSLSFFLVVFHSPLVLVVWSVAVVVAVAVVECGFGCLCGCGNLALCNH